MVGHDVWMGLEACSKAVLNRLHKRFPVDFFRPVFLRWRAWSAHEHAQSGPTLR